MPKMRAFSFLCERFFSFSQEKEKKAEKLE